VVAGDAAVDSAAIDGPGTTNFCLHDAMVMACLAQMPATPRMIMSPTAIDTDKPDDCAPDAVGSPAYCIIAGSSITIASGQTLSAHGSRPLVLMSSTTITVIGTIDVAGHVSGTPQTAGPGVPPAPGAASNPCAPATATTAHGGGAGGSFGSIGGGGGADDGNNPGGVPADPMVPATLRGGCAGEAGLDAGGGAAGGGGGAVALLALMKIQIDGVINASGGGGGGTMTNDRGGGGGGAGGMIVFDAPLVTGAGGPGGAKIFANGGGGGEGNGGAGSRNGGDAPMDPNMAAKGGGGMSSGGDGGDGAARNAQGGNAAGAGTKGNPGGGGGGGGGVGVIKTYPGQSLPGTVSPPAS
jgi:hypothetical protein